MSDLLKVSNKDTPMIHPFFEFPDYKVIWDDAWITDMLTIYRKYITESTRKNCLKKF